MITFKEAVLEDKGHLGNFVLCSPAASARHGSIACSIIAKGPDRVACTGARRGVGTSAE